jgi:hypothetical protein
MQESKLLKSMVGQMLINIEQFFYLLAVHFKKESVYN